MSEGDSGPVDPGGGGGSFWTSFPAILTASAVFIGAVVSAVVALRSDGGGSDTSSTTTTSPPPGRIIAEVTRPSGRVYYEGETMFVKASRPAQPMLALAESEVQLTDVGMKARVEWVSGAKDYGVGFVCRYANAGNYYLLSVLSGGRYHIARYRKGRLQSLVRGTSGALDNDANDLGVRCVGSEPVILTLTVDGRDVASARDPLGIEAGNIGIRLGTSESVVTCSFRDFDLRSLG